MNAYTAKKRILQTTLPALFVLAACGEGASPPTASAAKADTPAATSSAAPAKAPVAPELEKALDATAKCKVFGGSLQRCTAANDIETYVKAHREEATVDACLDALEDPARRRAGAACLFDYVREDSTVAATRYSARAFDRGLAALEAEKDAEVRVMIAWALRGLSAERVGKAGAVVARIRATLAVPEADDEISMLASTLLEGYLAQTAPKPAEAAIALAKDLLHDKRWKVRFAGVSILSAARSSDGCHAIAGAAESEARDDVLDETFTAIARGGDACAGDFEAIAKVLVRRVERAAAAKRDANDELTTVAGARYFVTRPSLSASARAAVAKAADQWMRAPKLSKSEKERAKLLADDAHADPNKSPAKR